ncbi:hypothetical protein OEG84_17190 [Hoeflea sp. G2-23]|uniref:Tetratricopeptide repeat protein n=1 Tax=Hoeflea algicola TaxID=2983763 RepID=A0ABT3ZC71_9HYPH|nr:hypothetical protein [Hoeflea algicola]MCY0149398.1 hypothetical protein [Hoeflea algicola]
MRRYKRFSIPAGIVALTLFGIWSVPGEALWLRNSLRDGVDRRAQAVSLYASGDREAELLLGLVEANNDAGDQTGAEALLAELAELHPRKSAYTKRLAEQRLTMLDVDGYVDALLRLPVSELTAAETSAVLARLRIANRSDTEANFLSRLARHAPSDEVVLARLGLLHAAAGRIGAAIDCLGSLAGSVAETEQIRLTRQALRSLAASGKQQDCTDSNDTPDKGSF